MRSIDKVPLICLGTAKGMLAAQLRHSRVTLGLLEDGDELAIGKTGRLHTELSKILVSKNSTLNAFIWWGDFPINGVDK